MTLLSVVTVCKDDIEGLRGTVSSYVAQDSSDTEQVMVVAPSADGSHELALSFEGSNTRVFTLPAQGIYHAMNYGWQQAHGEWILFLNAGDFFATSESLKQVTNFLRYKVTNEQMVLFGGIVSGSGINRILIPKGRLTQWRFAYGFLKVIHPSVLMRRELIKEIGGFSEAMSIASDYDLIIRALDYPTTTCELQVTRFTPGGVSSSNASLAIQESRQVRMDALNLKGIRGYLDYVWFSHIKIRVFLRSLLRGSRD